jgi:hypothetical protein
MTLIDRYSSAVRASDLRNDSEPDITLNTHTDILGAFALASKTNPLAVALARLFCGDNGASAEIVNILAQMAWDKGHAMRITLKRTQAQDLASAVVAWHRDGNCKACGGHGFELIPGAPAVSDRLCIPCSGTRKVPFGPEFAPMIRPIAWWLSAEIEREQSRAGPAAMAKLASALDCHNTPNVRAERPQTAAPQPE